MRNGKEIQLKRKVKLKGLCVPKFIVYWLGRMDAKADRIKIDDLNMPSSAWLKRKTKDFVSYSAQVRDATKKVNNTIVQQIIRKSSELQQIEILLKKYENVESNFSECTKKDKKQLRMERRRESNLCSAEDRKKQIISQLGVLVETINLSEHETEQMLLDYRSRLESMITIYLQGASKHMDITTMSERILVEDKESETIYNKRCVLTENLRKNLIAGGILNYEKIG